MRPYNIIDDFGADPFRYFLMRDMVFGQDQNYSDEAFVARYNADLANDFGNTLSRALKMSDSYFGGKTPPTPCEDNDLLRASTDARSGVPHRDGRAGVSTRARSGVETPRRDQWVHCQPRAVETLQGKRGGRGAVARHLEHAGSAAHRLRDARAVHADAVREALARIGADPEEIDVHAFDWGGLPNNSPVRVTEPLFPRIDTAAYIGGTMSNPPIETTQAVPPDLTKITIDQFMEIDLRVGEIRAAEKVEKAKKLIKLTVFDGENERTLVAGIATKYTPEELVGRKVVIVANLQPATLMGIESNGMVLAASISGEPSLLSVDASVPAGTKVK